MPAVDTRPAEPLPVGSARVRSGRGALEIHALEVARLVRLTAQHLRIPSGEVDRIELAALLHDVGKATIPDSRLGKRGELDAEEWRIMGTHTLIGERIVLGAPSLAHAADLVRSSQERIDGSGYPDGLVGDEIPRGGADHLRV